MANKNKTGVSPLAAAVTGAILGAGVAVAGAVVLSDKKNRDKVKDAFETVKDKAKGQIDAMKDQADETKSEMELKLTKGKEEVKKAARSTNELN